MPGHQDVGHPGPVEAAAPAFVGPPRSESTVALAPTPVEPAPGPRTVGSRDPFTAAVADPTVFSMVDAKLPVLFSMADATDAEVARKFKAEFESGAALRLDLFAKDTLKAAELFNASVRAGGTQVLVDGTTQEYLKRKVPLAWGVYTESLTASDLSAVLKRLAEADAKIGATPIWTMGHLMPAATGDGKDAKDLFAVDPAGWKKAKNGPAPAAPAEAAPAKPVPGLAVMTTYLPLNFRPAGALSATVKKYHDDKPAKKDGAVPLMVVIRPGN
jgi:hypothetical protein